MGLSAPIFVVGMNGSGTGALTRSLAQHSSVYAFPGESRIFLSFMGRFPEPPEELSEAAFLRLRDEIALDDGLIRWNGRQKIPLAESESPTPRSLAGALDSAFLYFAAQENKTRWCEKTPRNASCIESLVAHFPDAKILHVIRDGRDAALSFERRFGFSPIKSLYTWKKLLREARSQGGRVGAERYREVRYEELTTSPTDVLKDACEFLDMEFESGMLSPVRPTNAPMLAGSFVANSGKWRELASDAQIQMMESIAGKSLDELGYSVTNTAGDQDLPGWKLLVYEAGDGLHAARRYAKRALSGSGSVAGKIRIFTGLAISSLRARIRRR